MRLTYPITIDKLFLKRAIVNGCWEWTGCLNLGYGEIRIKEGYKKYKLMRVHRLAYILLKGKIPKDFQLDHLCRNRACFNPDHLEPVPAAENKRRGESFAAKAARKTHCKYGHEFTVANTYRPPKRPTNRHCIKCGRLSNKSRKAILTKEE